VRKLLARTCLGGNCLSFPFIYYTVIERLPYANCRGGHPPHPSIPLRFFIPFHKLPSPPLYRAAGPMSTDCIIAVSILLPPESGGGGI